MSAAGHSNYIFDFGPGITSPYGRFTRRSVTAGGELKPFEYRFSDVSLVRPLAALLPAIHADLLDVAIAAYLADLRAPRPNRRADDGSPSAGSTWNREMRLSIPVRYPGLWNDEGVKRDLSRLLWFLTNDAWSIEFHVRKEDPRASEVQGAFLNFVPEKANIAVLHSGGLDALLGMVRAVIEKPDARFAAISSISHPRTWSLQHSVLTSMREMQRAEWLWLQNHLSFENGKYEREDRESSQRTRGLLYLTIGAVAADLAGSSELHLSENGVGAISLPYAPDQIGALTNKSAHPRTLMLFEKIFNQVSGSTLRITNPLLWATKSEVCTELIAQMPKHFLSVIHQTVSCDRFPWYDIRQACGRCSSCVFRRLTSVASPKVEIDNLSWRHYDFDPLASTADWSETNLVAYAAIRSQAAGLRLALTGSTPFEDLFQTYPDLGSVEACAAHLQLSRGEIRKRIVRLLRRHIDEVDKLVSASPQSNWHFVDGARREVSIRRVAAS